MVFRVLHVSDTHLSLRHGHFAANAEAVRRHVVASAPDLVVTTGDLCMDGAGDAADLDLAARWHAGLGVPVRAVPGNHDVGDTAAIRPDQTVDDARLAAWRARFGDDFWVHDVEDWRLIGLDAMLFDTGHPEEERQWRRLAEAAATDRRIALFLHKPLFVDHVGEGARGYWTVRPEPRGRLLAAIGAAELGLVGSGHLHVVRIRRVDGVDHVWAPSSAFVCGPMQEDLGGERVIGAVEHVFEARTVASRYVRPEGARDLPIDDVHHEIYPPFA